ncbi:MAG: hypothetical protein AB1706_10215 [Pseudomonadota bacterium]
MSERMIFQAKKLELERDIEENEMIASAIRLSIRQKLPSEAIEPDSTKINTKKLIHLVSDLHSKVERIKELKEQLDKVNKELGF